MVRVIGEDHNESSFRTKRCRGAQYLVSPEVGQAVQHRVSQDRILLLPQFEQQNRDEGGHLQTHRGFHQIHTRLVLLTHA